MPRPKHVDDWVDADGVAKPTQILRNVGCVASNSKRGPEVGLFLRYQETASGPELIHRFHLPVATAREVARLLGDYADLAENHMPAPPPKRTN